MRAGRSMKRSTLAATFGCLAPAAASARAIPAAHAACV